MDGAWFGQLFQLIVGWNSLSWGEGEKASRLISGLQGLRRSIGHVEKVSVDQMKATEAVLSPGSVTWFAPNKKRAVHQRQYPRDAESQIIGRTRRQLRNISALPSNFEYHFILRPIVTGCDMGLSNYRIDTLPTTARPV
jgi:hypothetical protein